MLKCTKFNFGWKRRMQRAKLLEDQGPGIRGTDSWLDDTDKNVGPDLPFTV